MTTMGSTTLWLAGIVSALLFIYLFYALIKPERF
ncbi:MAG TPA: K(+)-transporting ATPase subunit F [Burkholderiaceae bacterium]|nr:K(+)-transporting ATPase subunit F [Burkholderiaceae bacterium]